MKSEWVKPHKLYIKDVSSHYDVTHVFLAWWTLKVCQCLPLCNLGISELCQWNGGKLRYALLAEAVELYPLVSLWIGFKKKTKKKQPNAEDNTSKYELTSSWVTSWWVLPCIELSLWEDSNTFSETLVMTTMWQVNLVLICNMLFLG